MKDVATLIDLLAYRARETATTVAYTYLDQPRTYGHLWQSINQFATIMQRHGLQPADRAVIALPNGHEFFTAFYGVQRAGGIAVPIFPGFSPDRILAMVRLCQARIVILPATIPADRLAPFQQQAAAHRLTLLTVAGSEVVTPEDDFRQVSPDDIAFIQYTSGSTGDPKGVQLSHRNLLTNVKQMIAGMEITPDEIFVSWLPVYHDMGLILKTMVPFYLAAQLFLLPTSLRDIRAWLTAIQTHRATFTAAPDFAYRLCLRYVKNPADYNLSSLRVALNAAEPVRARTIREFEATFDLQNVMVAGYGLAEATVGVSMWPPSTPNKIDVRGTVSVGRPFPHIDLTILQDGQPVAAGEIGEIAIKSKANSRGYFNNPQATQALFWDADTILSGDLGYLDAEGYLYIVGRKKNIIIHAGHTVYPAEIEEVANQVAEVRYTAAIGVDRGRLEGEQVTIFAEVRRHRETPEEVYQGTIVNIVQSFYDRFGFRPGRVYLVKPKTIPMTHNGKLRHTHLKQLFLEGRLHEDGRILYPKY
jgi:acyl-CoA synthetase (AMP-forming)/AMP-acid ligase II